mmetsp:Transcript_34511/g.102717  ORF Transcript_34511/g.102717 Transcript_34511/m.102717 type:complete len:236 (-) Transcript_34511:38-745(-)
MASRACSPARRSTCSRARPREASLRGARRRQESSPLRVQLWRQRQRHALGERRVAEKDVGHALRLTHRVRARAVQRQDGLGALELRQLGALAAACKLPAVVGALEPRLARGVHRETTLGERRQPVRARVGEALEPLFIPVEHEWPLEDLRGNRAVGGHVGGKHDRIPVVQPRVGHQLPRWRLGFATLAGLGALTRQPGRDWGGRYGERGATAAEGRGEAAGSRVWREWDEAGHQD